MKHTLLLAALAALTGGSAVATPAVTRLTPPSELFSTQRAAPVIARFLPGQRFDLQATVKPDAGQKITAARFMVDGKPVSATVALRDCATGCVKGVAVESAIATVRAVSSDAAGVHEFSVEATQTDGQKIIAKGNFEVIPFTAAMGPKVKNIIIMLGDGMGASQRTAARIVHGYAQGKALQPLAMDTFTATAMVKTSSLNSIVTDSSPGMTSYVSGNKNNNNEEGVFPDDTVDAFDNPRVEYLSEYLHRTQGKQLGVVTTADVFDATPAGNAVHTSNRGAGTGIVDQFFDDRSRTGLTVLMGGGRKWFLPAGTPGSARTDSSDYAFSATEPHTSEIVKRWGVAAGAMDKGRDLIGEFQTAGYSYAATKADLDKADPKKPLLGLFAFSNMNVALDKIAGRRGTDKNGLQGGSVVADFGLPDQPMLDEMAAKAIGVLKHSPKGFVLLVEGASIDKQAHNMDTERWMLDTLEFDRAVRVAQDFAAEQGDTIVIVTADHECSGAALIGGSMVTDAKLAELGTKKGVANLRNSVVGVYEKAGFPHYQLADDGYPQTTDIDYRLLVGYGANADRYEDWRTKKTPQRDSQQPFAVEAPLKWYPANANERDDALGEYQVVGQVPGESAVHTATDVPLSAYGPGALAFTGVIDNTDVFFKLAQAAVKGVVAPADTSGSKKPPKPSVDPHPDTATPASARKRWRWVAVLAFVVVLWAVLEFTGLRARLNLQLLRDSFQDHVALGLLTFTGLFAVANLMHIPGGVFLTAAVLAFGPVVGGGLTYVVANIACLLTFFVIRLLGGADALRGIDNKITRRVFARLDAHPLRSVIVLRLIFQTMPTLNYALALSGVHWRHYLLGTLLGLPIPIIVMTSLLGTLASWFGWS